jgi:hypothetical protein
VNSGLENEGYNAVANGRANYGSNSGWNASFYNAPVKVGFSATNSSGRLSAGAAYYGVMEMSGNVGEIAVAAKTAGGSTYTGILGDGILSTVTATDGDADQSLWPDQTGLLLKGGHFESTVYNGSNAARLVVSDRAEVVPATRYQTIGGRGVR